MFPKSTHETFAQKLYQTFQKHKRFVKPKLSRTDFTICHYAGEVSFFRGIQLHEGIIVRWCLWTCGIQVLYQSDQFLDKNKDYVVAEHQELLSASKCSFISGLFPPPPEETSKSSKFSSIGARFKVSSTFFSFLSILLLCMVDFSFLCFLRGSNNFKPLWIH